MKYSIFIIVSFWLFYGCINSISKKPNNLISTQKTKDKTAAELYRNSLNILDSITMFSKSNDDFSSIQAVKILAEISGYEGEGNHNYFGTFGFKEKDLNYWKEWFNNNKESLNYLYESQSPLSDALNIERYQVTKVDTLENSYLVYTRKNDSILKILSFRKENFKNCENIKVGAYYDFILKPFFQSTSNKKSKQINRFIFEEPNISFKLDTNRIIFLSENLKGLCYLK
ncbi:MAG: hypothetical protein COZ75_02865 [Flavobacteriaceae bacterium CG_4_8_14_3_um_filter_34_10]|nr:hypothetical protein [Flavobacteriia bacterium]PIQ18034.1 MAG: hypothetical protein COW66_08560 [Flavobacteriaceae bacterium CG18_big_fil_WC_8_21_14_2_50_34_36]PIV50119.1 MAG: hypothetical protein COS19_05110 [Flavobacteriaceae bacterium CG02_land_8_20_14_3_00_34_13]PIX10184.1 MAG: hypothetical protein COZ75_02865 [Flavobacteriaceae bacterium CG_4_8_14_3_um_filter_34_10]